MTLIAGSILQNGRYVIQSVISQGKIDITYAAKHTYLDQAVRIKTLQPRLRSHYEDINVQEEFTRRAARFARCSNPHLVRVIDGFEEDWMPFLVLKTFPGIGLAQQLPDISLPQTLAVMRQLVPAVQFLHDQNLVHGNICLDNIVSREESAPKTLDIVLTSMGLRSFVPSLRQSLDEEYPDLLSPQADLQALAVVLCELLVGQPQSLSALQSPETISEVRSRYSQLPDSLDPILAEGLNPTEGQSVASWFAQLEPSLTQALESVVPTASTEPLLERDETAATVGDDHQPDLDAAASAPQDTLLTPLKISPEPTSEPAYSEVGDSSSGNSATMTATHQSSHSGSPQATQTRSPQRSWKLPIALGLTSLVAAVGGGYFGLNFRLQEPEDLERSPIFGREMFGSDQSFPASDRWPGESDYEGRTSPLFEAPNTLNYSQPSALELDVPSTTPNESYQSEPRQVEPSPVEEEEYNFQEDVNLGTDTKPFPEEDFSVYEQEPAANAEGDRPAASPPAAQPAPAPPPPPSASSNSSLDILIAPSPSRSEPPTSTQLNTAPKPSSSTNSL